jgi:tRNA nucleotidyltransferase/poly(A) polymerase
MQILLDLFKEFALKRGIADDTYIVGGAVRDMFLGLETKDIDLVVSGDALEISKKFAQVSGGSFVLLDSKFAIARVVRDAAFLDISDMRGGSITADLSGRDITINAMAQPLREWRSTDYVIDPFGGREDLQSRVIRMVSERNLISDPLRILRIYRFSAALHSLIEINTRRALKKHKALLTDVAVERIAEELRHMMALGDSHESMKEMAEDNIMSVLFPEFSHVPGPGIKKGLFCYGQCEALLGSPAHYFPLQEKSIFDYFALPARRICLKLTALFSGEAYALEAALRLKMSKKEAALIALISSGCENLLLLCGVAAHRSKMVRFLKNARDNVYPMAVLAVAAGKGHQGSSGSSVQGTLESGELVLSFCNKILSLYVDEVLPRIGILRLITGDDLIREFDLPPSSQFKLILSELEDDILEGKVNTRDEALRTVRSILAREV